ncbi:hypothetical protein KBA27_06060 [bacterium]|nr:hypothetical protein [bacterium]
MASIIDSFRETFEDNLSFVKIAVFAIPLYYCYTMSLTANGKYGGVWTLGLITAFFLIGYFAEITSGVLNEGDCVLPSLNFLKMAISSLKLLISIGPLTLIAISIANFALSFTTQIPLPWLITTIQVIVWLIVISISLSQFLLFVRKESIISAYNLKAVSDKCGDIIVGLIFFVIQLLLINIPTCAFLGYTIGVLFGIGPVLYAFLSYAVIFNIAATGHYFAQLGYEIMGYDKRDTSF